MADKTLTLKVNAILFDVDGTIIISQPALAEFWRDFGKNKEGFDAEHVIEASHGWRTHDAIAKFAPDYAKHVDATQLESEIPDKFGQHAIEVKGASRFCGELNNLPKDKWAVATSGTEEMATKWFELVGIEKPEIFITANDVNKGKPNAEPYLRAREGLHYKFDPQNPSHGKVVVFEDAPAGIKAGQGAGCKIVGVATTYDKDALIEKGCDIVIKDHNSVKVGGYDSGKDEVELIITNPLYVKDDIQTW